MAENIEQAIAAIYKEVGYVQKQRAPGLNYSYAGEAALIEAIRPAMVEQGVTVRVSRVLSRDRIQYETRNGAPMFTSSVTLELTFVHAPSGTKVTVETAGDGGDVGDKSLSKAITSAYKYGLRNTFMIETGDDPDGHKSEPPVNRRQQQNGRQNTPRNDVDPSSGELPPLIHPWIADPESEPEFKRRGIRGGWLSTAVGLALGQPGPLQNHQQVSALLIEGEWSDAPGHPPGRDSLGFLAECERHNKKLAAADEKRAAERGA